MSVKWTRKRRLEVTMYMIYRYRDRKEKGNLSQMHFGDYKLVLHWEKIEKYS